MGMTCQIAVNLRLVWRVVTCWTISCCSGFFFGDASVCLLWFLMCMEYLEVWACLQCPELSKLTNYQSTFFFLFFSSPSINISCLSKLLHARPLCLQDNKNVKEKCSRSVFCVLVSEAEKIYLNVYSMILRHFVFLQSWFTKLVVLKMDILLQISPWS